jgi:hypothetical protein
LDAIFDRERCKNLLAASLAHCLTDRFNELQEIGSLLADQGLTEELTQFADIATQRHIIAGEVISRTGTLWICDRVGIAHTRVTSAVKEAWLPTSVGAILG